MSSEPSRHAITYDDGAILVWTEGKSVAMAVSSHTPDWTATLDMGQATELREALQASIAAAVAAAES